MLLLVLLLLLLLLLGVLFLRVLRVLLCSCYWGNGHTITSAASSPQ